MTDIFGNQLVYEETLILKYEGEKFNNGEIPLDELLSELQGLKILISEILDIYVDAEKITRSETDFQIIIKIEQGSLKQIVKFIKKNETTLNLIAVFIMPFLQDTFDHYLHRNENSYQPKQEIIDALRDNSKIRNSIEKTMAPITGNGNNLVINNGDGDVNIIINTQDKNRILDGIQEDNSQQQSLEYIKEEELIGVVSVSKFYDENPFNFRVDGTEKDVQMIFLEDLDFNLERRQEFLGKKLKIKAKVTYKNQVRKLIEVQEHKFENELF
ncbi:hypothetical protein KC866_02315 [Patescibacteria group bacterium]|nr:hypothetical protein [Patescibacteria group bacterium]